MARSNAFSARDLALFVPDDNAGDIAHRTKSDSDGEDDLLVKPKIDSSKKTTRYFPGKAPQWVAASTDAPGPVVNEPRVDNISIATSSSVSPGDVPVPVDSRMARLMASASAPVAVSARARARVVSSSVNDDDSAPTRTVFAGSISSAPAPTKADAVDSADMGRQSHQQLGTSISIPEFEPSVPRPDAAARVRYERDSDSGSGSEYETVTDSSEEEEEEVLLRPVFVPRGRRETVVSVDEQQQAEDLRASTAMLKAEEKKRETRRLVAESLQRAEAESLNRRSDDVDSDAECPDVNDGATDVELSLWADRDLQTMTFPVGKEGESSSSSSSGDGASLKQTQFDELVNDFRQWKLREMGRCLREARLTEQRAREAAEIQRLHGLTDEERLREMESERRRAGTGDQSALKEQYKFLQKYYHKGAFYHENDTAEERAKEMKHLAQEDTSTLGDNTGIDKSVLPKVMQVKNFGRRGQTKYTHLADQDTTFAEKHQPSRRDEYTNEGYATESRAGALASTHSSTNYKKKQRVTE